MYERLRLVLSCLSTGLLLSGCGATENNDGKQARPTPIDPDAVALEHPELVRVIGSASGRESPAFGNLTEVIISPNGELIALDGTAKVALVLNGTGSVQDTIGREGQGPGEFLFPADGEIIGDTILQIVDPPLSRVTWFRLDGSVVRTAMMPAQGQFGQPTAMQVAADGAILNLGFDRYQQSLEDGIGRQRRGVVRGENTIQRWAEGLEHWTDVTAVPGLEVYVDQDAQRIQDIRYARAPLWAPSLNGGFWVADNSEYVIRQFSAAGTAGPVIAVSTDPVAVSAAERKSYYSADDVPATAGDRLARVRRDRQNLPLKDIKPPLFALIFIDDALWVGLAGRGEMREWHVFDPAGKMVSRYSLPESFTPRATLGNRLYGISVDGLGVNRIAEYSLPTGLPV